MSHMPKLSIAIWSGTIALGVLFMLAVGQIWAAPSAAPTADPVEVCNWLDCKPGAVSYSQDDAGNVNSIDSCRPLLETAGFLGTFYYDGTTPQDWMADFTAAGHEVGSHLANHNANCTWPHPSCEPDCTLADLRSTPPYSQTIVDDFRNNQIDANVSAIEAATGEPVVSMAYPCGSTDANRMAASESYFLGARGYYDPWDGADFPWITDTNASILPDPMLLNSDNGTHDDLLLDRAINDGQWAIFTMHDACSSIDKIADQQANLWVAPIGEVLKYINVRDAAQFSNYVLGSRTISFDASDSLSTLQRQTVTGNPLLPIVFDNQVTLSATLPSDNGVWQVLVDSVPVSYTVDAISGVHNVFFNTSLNTTRHITIGLATATAVQLLDLRVRADTDPGQNLGWLLAMIVMGTSGLAGLITVTHNHRRR